MHHTIEYHPIEERRETDSGVLSPMRQPIFRALWTAALVSNVGTFVQDTAGQSYLKTAAHDALAPALLQSANYLPMAVFGFAAGTLADMFGARRVVIAAQWWMLASAVLLVVAAITGLSVNTFLLFAFLLAIGQAFATPALFSVIPEMVLPRRGGQAYVLNSVAFNGARAIGPIVAAIVLTHNNYALAFALNAASFLAVIVVLTRWHSHAPLPTATSSMRGEMLHGMSRLLRTRSFLGVLTRAAVFGLLGVSLSALLPSIERSLQNSDYALLLYFFGVGVVLAIEIVGYAHRRLGLASSTSVAALTFGGACMLVGNTSSRELVAAALVVAGAAWLIINSTLVTMTAVSVAANERGRAMALYFTVLFAGMASGAAIVGRVADVHGIGAPRALAVSGLILAVLSAVDLAASSLHRSA
jgi:MFS family permease